MRSTVIVAILGLAWIDQAAGGISAPDIEARLNTIATSRIGGDVILSLSAVRQFYAARGFQPAWTPGTRKNISALHRAIVRADEHGLRPEDYHTSTIFKSLQSGDVVGAELLASDAYLTFGAHLLNGRLNPVTVEPNWTIGKRSRDLIAHLESALKSGHITDSLNALAPALPGYGVLQSELRTHREIAAKGGWPSVPPGPTLKVGMQGPRIAALRLRLAANAVDPSRTAEPEDLFDPALEEAVAAFQRGIGLEADGIAGPITLRELNRTAGERVGQLRANLERLRWLPDELGKRHVRVNIAAFQLEVWDNGRRIRRHDVIVGRPYRKTPVFSSEISYVVLNPSWDTPRSIARLDKLPAFQQDPSLAQRLGFEVYDSTGRGLDPGSIDWRAYNARNFDLRLRQRPGPQNALGVVKLMFPNPHNIYLHDTPTRELFERTQRDFSSGCIRVRDVMELVIWALSGRADWDRSRVDAIVASGRETRVDLPTKIPVHLNYLTVVTTGEGKARFLADVYERDARLIIALDEPPPRSRR